MTPKILEHGELHGINTVKIFPKETRTILWMLLKHTSTHNDIIKKRLIDKPFYFVIPTKIRMFCA